MDTTKALFFATLTLAIAACGDDPAGGSGTGGGGGGGSGGAASTGATFSSVAAGPGPGSTTTSSAGSTGTGGADECDPACGAGTSCQLCADPLFPEDAAYECAPLDPDPTAEEFRCGEENCARGDEVCIEGDYVFDQILCGEPQWCRGIAEACDDCACAIERIDSSFCVEVCSDDGAGAVYISGSDLQGFDCLNCTDPGEPCTDDAECCALDGLDAFCNDAGECQEDDGGGK